MKVLEVISIDMSYNTGIWDSNNLVGFGLVTVKNVGYLMEDREDCLVLAREVQPEEGQVRHLVAIPKVCISKVEEITQD